MKKKYIISGIQYSDLDFSVYYFNEEYKICVFHYKMQEDFYKELKNGKKPKCLILDDNDSKYGKIEYKL